MTTEQTPSAAPKQAADQTSSLVDSAFFANPYPSLAHLREAGPLYRMKNGFGREVLVVTRYEEAVRILKDPRFSSEIPKEIPAHLLPVEPLQELILNQMTCMDPPRHGRLRGLIAKAFTPRFIESLRPRIQQISDELIDQVLARSARDGGSKTMDFITDFAFPLPIIVIAEMLGVPTADRERLHDWSGAIFYGISGDKSPKVTEQMREFRLYIQELISSKRGQPGEDLISKLVAVEEAGQRLNELELVSMVALLVFAGHETTVSLLGNGLLALFDHPEQLALLQREPERIPAAVEEILRYCGPVLSIGPRIPTADVELGGQLIRAGEPVLIALGAANRDPRQFTSGEELNISREIDRHLAFGGGIHFCLGAPLARMEAAIAFATLFRRMPQLRLNIDPADLSWRASFTLRGPTHLPVAF